MKNNNNLEVKEVDIEIIKQRFEVIRKWVKETGNSYKNRL